MAARLEEKRLLDGRIILQCRQSGELEELDGEACRVHLEWVADNAVQIAFYSLATPQARVVIRIRSGSTLRIVGDEEP